MGSSREQAGRARPAPDSESARKRAAIETYARHEAALRRTARRYSLCADDADDAVQRAFEILLRKAPTENPRELIRWMQTVVRHEALAVRRERERDLSGPAASPEPEGRDWVDLIPADADGPPERAERREAVARSREALQSLKPQELRALALLAEGYSYAEISEITGYTRTKINRCLAEGRERFRSLLSRSEDGSRCVELRPVISAFCDGEAGPAEAAALREHLRACSACRATVRAYRAAPAAAAALMPPLPVGRSLLDRIHDALAGLAGRLSGAADSAVAQVAGAGGPRGAGTVGLAKAIGLCVGTAGGAAACAATGVVPVPFAAERDQPVPKVSRQISPAPPEASREAPADYEPEPAPSPQPETADQGSPPASEAAPPGPPAASSGAVEYAPPPPPAAPASVPEAGGGDPAGEFGP